MQGKCDGGRRGRGPHPEMANVACFDRGTNTNDVGQAFAFNLMVCNDCGRVAKEDVWSRPGITWLDAEGGVERTGPEVETGGGFKK